MAVAKKKPVYRGKAKAAPHEIAENPPEGNLDNFFGWLNEKYGIQLPRLNDCPDGSAARKLLSRKILYEKTPRHMMYLARIVGGITVFDKVILSGIMVQIEKKV